MITKEETENITKVKGEVRGVVFQTDAEYVRRKKGEEGLKKVKEELERLGHPIDYEKAKALGWYPLGLRALSLLVIKDIFKLDNEEIKNMGNTAPKYSFIVKMLMKYFLSPEETLKHAPSYWTKHYSIGELVIAEYNNKENYTIVQLKDIRIHPILCKYLEGYFSRFMQYTVAGKISGCEERKCMFKGDPYHEFKVFWE